MINNFKKSDLKTGMRIKRRNNEWAIVLLGTANGDIYAGGETWGELDNYNEALHYISPYEGRRREYDIIEVRQPESNMDCLKDYYNVSGETIWIESGKSLVVNIGDIHLNNVTKDSDINVDEICKMITDKISKEITNLQLLRKYAPNRALTKT